MPGNGCVFYTATVVNSPRQIEDDVGSVHRRIRSLILQAIRTEEEPVIAKAQWELEESHDHFLYKHDWFSGKSERLERAEVAVSKAILEQAEKSRGVKEPINLLVVDEVDRMKMSDLEQLRAIFDSGGIGLVLISMLGLARYSQLYSRIGFVYEFRPLGGV